jgi:DNA-directed RNA polymerase subunit RPC12/RpoP
VTFLVEDEKEDKMNNEEPRSTHDACPNCGYELSPWQQVLLSIDRALVCKRCWYRIILDVTEKEDSRE